MKYIKYLSMLAGAAFMFASCQTDVEQPRLSPIEDVEAPVLNGHEDVVINGDNIKSEKVTFSCTKVDFGQPVEVTYSLYFSYAPEGGEAKEAFVGSANTNVLTFEKSVLNSAAVNGLGIAANDSADINAYVVASVAHLETEKSNSISFNIQTYKALFNHIFLVGAFQNWGIDKALPFWEVVAGTGIYETTVEFTADDSGFKIPDNRAWDGSERGFDWFTSKSENLTASDDGNLVLNKGIWTLNVDLNAKSIQATMYTAMDIAGSWDANWSVPIAMKFDANAGVWRSEKAIAGGSEFKVRMNGGWDISYGSTGAAAENLGEFDTLTEGIVLEGGDNIKAPEGGNVFVCVHADRTPWVISYEAE
ncbi:MAG: SusE domain-containing protein [Alistipes sp.]|nr:SusE domain-containing protein [Alistipes sp.]